MKTAQAPSQLSDRRPDSMPPDLWLPDEGCTTGVHWPGAEHSNATQQHAAATAEEVDGGLASVLAAVCDSAAMAVSTAHQGHAESSVLWQAEAALHRLPAKVSVPAQEPITLPPWGSRAAARPPAQLPLGEALACDPVLHGHIPARPRATRSHSVHSDQRSPAAWL